MSGHGLQFGFVLSLLMCGLLPDWPLAAQPFTFHWQISSIDVFDNQENPFHLPFLGGFSTPRPQLVDIDADGDLDLFIQDKSNQIIFFEHDQRQPVFPFVWRSSHFQGLNVGEWYRFADIDGDGDQDLLAERPFSLVQLYKNQGTAASFDFILAADTLFDDQGVPLFADRQNIPNVTDIDCNGQPDLFVGRADGTVRRYEVVLFDAQEVPIFTLIDERFQDIEIVAETGKRREYTSSYRESYSAKHGANTLAFIDVDGDGDEDLLWGDFFEAGLLYLENIGSCEAPNFLIEPVAFPSNAPLQSSGYNAPAFGDVDRDGKLDLLVGVLGGAFSAASNSAENLIFYKGVDGSIMDLQTRRYLSNLDFGSDSLPVLHDLDADGDLDLIVTNSIDPDELTTSSAIIFENRGSAVFPAFYANGKLALEPAFNFAPAFGDLDDDGDDDMLVGSWQGPMGYYRNEASSTERFTLVEADFLDLPTGSNSTPALVDIDDDGDLDVIAGEANGTLNFYQNIGNILSPAFAQPVENWAGIDAGRRSVPHFVDLDSDGDQDLIIGTDQDGIQFYRNIGNAQTASFQVEEVFIDLSVTRRVAPAIADLDADGDLDLMVGTLEGGLLYFENQAESASIEKKEFNTGVLIENYPSPFSDRTTLHIKSEIEGQVSIHLFDITGRQTLLLYEGPLEAEEYIDVDMSGFAEGVYFVRLTLEDGLSRVHALFNH